MPLTLFQQSRLGDPTRTLTLRQRYAQNLSGRMNRLRSDIRVSVSDRDAFGLLSPFLSIFQAARRNQFNFPTSDAKIDAFNAWLQEQIDSGILEVTNRDGARVTGRNRFQDTFIQRAYTKGATDADVRVLRSGLEIGEIDIDIVMRQRIHSDRVSLLFTRNFEELKGITEAVSQTLSRELAQGLSEGLGADPLAQRLTRVVNNIGRRRAQALARTEIIRAHSEGALNEYERLGIQAVTAEVSVEFSHAGDERVCAQCIALGGEVFTVSQARGIIPVHVGCRCTWLPVV